MKSRRAEVLGNALMIAVVLIAIFVATTGSMLSFALTRSKSTTEHMIMEQQTRAIDAVLAIKMNQIGRFHEESIVGTFADGTKYAVICRPHLSTDMFKLTAAVLAVGSKDATWIELIVERTVTAGASAFAGAIMAKQKIETSGNSIVNGNCFNLAEKRIGLGYCPASHFDPATKRCQNATCIAAGNSDQHPSPHKASAPSVHDTLAIVTMDPGPNGIVIGGGSNAGGCGDKRGDTLETSFPNSKDDGVDNDMAVVDRRQNIQWNRDFGSTAEKHFPTNADELLDSPFGTCKKRAQDKGTYFTTQVAFETWRDALVDGRVPANSIIYCDFKSPEGGPGQVDLDHNLEYGKTYHVVIQHKPKIAEVAAPRYGTAGATMTAYTNFTGVGNKTVTIAGTSYTLDDRDASHECADSAHGLYIGALTALSDHPSFDDDTTHAAGSLGHAAGAPKWDGFGYRKTEPDGVSESNGFQTKIFGVVIIDDQTNMNSTSLIFGGLATLAGDTGSTKNLCNGGARIRYSAAAIDRAIAQNLATGTQCDVKSYREHTPTRDAQAACKEIGITITIPATPEDRPDTSTSSTSDTVDGWFEPAAATVSAKTVG